MHHINIAYPRSFCPNCKTTLAWYDLIPVFSYLFLRGKCRYCQKTISWLYPFIEILSAIVLTALIYLIQPDYWFAYFIFFSALIVTIRTDIQYMLISRYVSIYLIPLGFLFSWANLLPINFYQSFIGAVFGYGLLLLIRTIYLLYTKKDGMGQGDLELLAFIGSFIGPLGAWFTLALGSIIGSIFAYAYLLFLGKRFNVKLPFGPFLAFGSMIFVLFEQIFYAYFNAF